MGFCPQTYGSLLTVYLFIFFVFFFCLFATVTGSRLVLRAAGVPSKEICKFLVLHTHIFEVDEMLLAWKGNDFISFFLFEIDGELFLDEVDAN